MKILRVVLPLVYLVVLAVPAVVVISARGGIEFFNASTLTGFSSKAFPLFGLYAFTLVWAQLMLGTNMVFLRRVFPWIETFHRWEGTFALLFALIHPTLLLVAVGFSHYFARDYITPALVPWIWVGYVQLVLIICTAGAALLRRVPWFQSRWRYIHYANYTVFSLAWLHSWSLGTDTGNGALRPLWIVFGITGAASAVWRFWRAAKETQTSVTSGTYVTVARAGEVPEGAHACVTANGAAIALFKVSGQFYALHNACVHSGGSLCNGKLEGTVVTCPLHASQFDVRTGALLRGPATRPQPIFPVRVVGDAVQVAVPT